MNKPLFNKIADEAMKWCIYTIIFTAPFSKSMSEIAITLAIILWVSRKIINKNFRIEKTELTIPLLVFVIATIPSLINSVDAALTIRAFFTKILKFVLLYFIIVETINTKSRLRDLFIIAVISMAVISIDGLGQYYYSGVDALHNYPAFKTRTLWSGEGSFRGFPTASFPFPNDLAAWILLVFFPLVGAVIFDLKHNKFRYFAAFLSSTLFYLFFLTKTRGAWLGLIVSFIFLTFFKKNIWLIAIIILLIAVPFILKMEMAKYIFETSSISDRSFMWSTGLEVFKQHPIIGSGINTFFINFKKLRNDEWKGKKGSYAHNCYLQMASDIGILGLSAFLWFIYSYFFSTFKALKKMRGTFYPSVMLGMSMGVLAFLVHSFFDTNLYSLNLATLFWCAVGISQSVINVSNTT